MAKAIVALGVALPSQGKYLKKSFSPAEPIFDQKQA
jgi:hypothetical protein